MSFNISRVMLPVDGSEYSMKAAQYALDVVCKSGECSVLLVHCHRPFPSYLGEPTFQEMVNKTLEKANALMEPYRRLFQSREVDFTDLLLEEPVGKRIAEVAENKKIDMIIMGTRGKTDLEGLIVGSVTHQVLHLAHCPVLVVR